jgi:hypothetical protein
MLMTATNSSVSVLTYTLLIIRAVGFDLNSNLVLAMMASKVTGECFSFPVASLLL